MQDDVIVLAGGCFWCTQAVLQRLRGVRRTVCGYAQGHVEQPTYEQVCTGTTGCAEAVQVTYDAQQLPLRVLLEVFFATHDPTTPNRQGADVGPQYRSGIYWTRPQQGELARALIEALQAQRRWPDPIVTEVEPLHRFTPAEPEHQHYHDRHPWAGYCVAVIDPKLAKLRQQFAAWLQPPP
ncbi:MAG: peptide-methionine (S)-S-oxide reductase MsrA [Tepidimonas sp.]|nr:peptide-methionine (S)-S-oxide reductase MsrA [Tepidimonas sp.]